MQTLMSLAPPAAPFDVDGAAYPPPDRTVALNLGVAAAVLLTVIVAAALDWVALKGVVIIGFLSVALAYLLLPLVQLLRQASARMFKGWRPSRILAVVFIYLMVGGVIAPVRAIWGQKIVSQVPNVAREVPRHVARFAGQLRASERWHERFKLESDTSRLLRGLNHRVSQRLQAEVSEIGAEVVRARLVVPWLVAVPVIALILVAQWPTFQRSAARALPTPHLKWRVDQGLRQVNRVLAAYTRAQALSALIVGTICGVGFALMKLPNAAMFGIVAGLLETVPIAGPLAVAISATSVATSSQVILVLAFLGTLRIVQDYVVYPRLIQQALHLHPVAVVLGIWFGALIGGVLGVCLAVPTVGILKVALQHLKEYVEIERLVREKRSEPVPPPAITPP